MKKCLLCLSCAKRGSKELDYPINDQLLAEVLKKHFPFVESLDQVVCQKCFYTVRAFDQLYTLVKKNQETGQQCTSSECQPKRENFSECLFVSSFPSIREVDLLNDNQVEPSDTKEGFLDYNDSFDDLYTDPTQVSEEETEPEPPKKKARKAVDKIASKVKKKFPAKKINGRSAKSEVHQEVDRMVKEHCEVRCEICETDFDAFSSLRLHYEKSHPEGRAVVSCCGNRFSSRNGAVDHIRMQHIVKFTKCTHCEQLFRTLKTLYEHMCSEHSKFRCWNCQRGFIKKQSLERHIKLCELTGSKFECFVCKKDTFRSYRKLRVHLTHHKNQELEKKAGKVYFCDVCSFSSRSRSSFHTHRQVHEQQRAFEEDGTGFPCEHCDKVFRSKPCIRQHMRLMHNGDLRQPCKICGKNVKFMDCHLMTHRDEPKVCPTCGITCKNKGVLKSHIRVKHVLVPHLPCQFCEKLFKKRTQLTEHEATHTKIPLYFCDKCAKTFNQRANYTTHIKKAHGIMSTVGLSASRKAAT